MVTMMVMHCEAVKRVSHFAGALFLSNIFFCSCKRCASVDSLVRMFSSVALVSVWMFARVAPHRL